MQSVCGLLEGNKVTVLCVFAEGSVAIGCMVTLITDTANTTASLSRISSSGPATGELSLDPSRSSSGYTLYVQDLEADSVISSLFLSGTLSTELAACNPFEEGTGNYCTH